MNFRRFLLQFPLVSNKLVHYNNRYKEGKEGNKVTEIIEKLNKVQLPPHQLKELGLDKDWQKHISPAFVEKVFKTAENYKNVLKKLSKK